MSKRLLRTSILMSGIIYSATHSMDTRSIGDPSVQSGSPNIPMYSMSPTLPLDNTPQVLPRTNTEKKGKGNLLINFFTRHNKPSESERQEREKKERKAEAEQLKKAQKQEEKQKALEEKQRKKQEKAEADRIKKEETKKSEDTKPKKESKSERRERERQEREAQQKLEEEGRLNSQMAREHSNAIQALAQKKDGLKAEAFRQIQNIVPSEVERTNIELEEKVKMMQAAHTQAINEYFLNSNLWNEMKDKLIEKNQEMKSLIELKFAEQKELCAKEAIHIINEEYKTLNTELMKISDTIKQSYDAIATHIITQATREVEKALNPTRLIDMGYVDSIKNMLITKITPYQTQIIDQINKTKKDAFGYFMNQKIDTLIAQTKASCEAEIRKKATQIERVIRKEEANIPQLFMLSEFFGNIEEYPVAEILEAFNNNENMNTRLFSVDDTEKIKETVQFVALPTDYFSGYSNITKGDAFIEMAHSMNKRISNKDFAEQHGNMIVRLMGRLSEINKNIVTKQNLSEVAGFFKSIVQIAEKERIIDSKVLTDLINLVYKDNYTAAMAIVYNYIREGIKERYANEYIQDNDSTVKYFDRENNKLSEISTKEFLTDYLKIEITKDKFEGKHKKDKKTTANKPWQNNKTDFKGRFNKMVNLVTARLRHIAETKELPSIVFSALHKITGAEKTPQYGKIMHYIATEDNPLELLPILQQTQITKMTIPEKTTSYNNVFKKK